MIDRLQGVVVTRGAEGVSVSVGGVAFALEVSAVTRRDVPAPGEEVELFTHMHVRDDAIQLFGFSSEEERELFRMLIGVSKIGPKLALAALSSRRPQELKKALAAGDVAVFDSVSGIGKKTAERIILELKEKMGETGLAPSVEGEGSGVYPSGDSIALARSALVELGYTVAEAERLLVGVDDKLSVEELVRQALAGKA